LLQQKFKVITIELNLKQADEKRPDQR